MFTVRNVNNGIIRKNVEMPYIPRIGETLCLYVKNEGVGGGFKKFTVVDIVYMYADKQHYDITVYVELMGVNHDSKRT